MYRLKSLCCSHPKITDLIKTQIKKETSSPLGVFVYMTLVLKSHALIHIMVDIKIVSEYDQEIPQSQNADKPVSLPGRAT